MSTAQVSSQLLSQLVKRARNLYSLPTVATRVLELTRRADMDARELKECIENDPALTAKLLRVVNSSSYGLSGEVADLHHAIALLGIKPLRLLVLGFSLPRTLFAGVEAPLLRRYWRDSLYKAVAAREISEQVLPASGEEPFIAGLLQDIGMLVLVQQLGESYAEFLDGAESSRELLQREQKRLGFNHTRLSAKLLEDWGLAPTTVSSVEMPYDSEAVLSLAPPQQTLNQVLHLAELATNVLTHDDSHAVSELMDVSAKYGTGLTPERLPRLLSGLQHKVSALAKFLDVQGLSQESYVDVLVDALSQISDLAEDWAEEGSADAPVVGPNTAGRSVSETMAPRIAPEAALDGKSNRSTITYSQKAALFPTASESHRTPTPARSAAADSGSVPAPCGDKSESISYAELVRRVTAKVTSCRQARRAVSLVLVEVDEFEELVFTHGAETTAAIFRSFSNAIARMIGQENTVLQVGDRRWTVILDGSERQQAVRLIRWLHDEIRAWFQQRATITRGTISVSIGLASVAPPPRSFRAMELIEAAEACLDGAQLQGGDVLKSIELY